MAQNQPLAGNDAVREYLNLLMGARPEAGREYAALLFEMDGMHRRLDAALQELAQVRGELARMQEGPEKGFLTHAMEAVEKRLHAMRQGLLEMKEQLISGAKEAVEGVRNSGIKALDKAVSAVGIKKGLEEMQQSLAGSIEDVRKYNNFSESSALISWGFQTSVSKNHPLFSQKHLTNQSKNAALRALDQKVHFLIGGDF